VVVRNGADLCLQCGMCCDGTLFSHAPVEPSESSLVEACGLAPPGSGELANFDLPCPAFVDGCCSRYTDVRPHVCGAYRCRPLEHYERGVATLDESAEIVHLVRGLVGSLEDEMGVPPGSFTRHVLMDYIARHDPQHDRDRYRAFLTTLDRLVYLGMRYFGYDLQPTDDTLAEAVPA
jgi:hypothetical protein